MSIANFLYTVIVLYIVQCPKVYTVYIVCGLHVHVHPNIRKRTTFLYFIAKP